MNVSYNQLTDLTGLAYRTIKRRLDDAAIKPTGKNGRAILYNSVEALPVLFGKKNQDEQIDLQKERALESRERRRKLERENDIADGLVVAVETITIVLQSVSAQAVPILESLPLKIKKRIPALTGRDLEWIQKEVAKCRNAIAKIKS